MLWTNGLHLVWLIGLVLGSAEAADNTCSDLEYILCHEDAICKEDDNGVFSKCVCKDGLEGDGLKGDENTGCGRQKCHFDTDCPPNAYCNDYYECTCDDGYAGDADMSCLDENECSDNPCHLHATCKNVPGSYECTCNMNQGYKGDGFNCTHKCSMDNDCGKNEKCIADVCVCKDGYELDVITCVDIDECNINPCNANAECNNTDGAFTCTCRNGYAGNGEVCTEIPKNCHEILTAKPNTNDGTYEVDPDGNGPMGTTLVKCEMRPGLGITILLLLEPGKVRLTNRKPSREYTYEQELPAIHAIISSSGYCYQEMRYTAKNGAILMNGDNYWRNGLGQIEKNWGGAEETGKCACGSLGYCRNRESACNADGTIETVIDNGKIINKAKLPVRQVRVKPGGQGMGEVYIGPVMCSPKPFDIPIDCHDARFNKYYKIQDDGPQVLDFDGPDGVLEPILAHCDMTTYAHVGVTVIPHKSTGYETPGQSGKHSLQYGIQGDYLNKLVDISHFCSQDAEYECTNSRLLNNGDKKGYFSDTRGVEKNYWPGGLGEANKCGCGIIGECALNDYGCNCDVKDGITRKDFGKVIDKKDLPIGSVTLLEIGGESNGTYKVGPLKCSQRDFGIPATCRDYVDEGFTDSYTYLIDADGPEDSGKGLLAPFPVYCRFQGDPLYAVTVIYHQWRTEEVFINTIMSFMYIHSSTAQIEALVTRSVSCTQSVSFSCIDAPLHAANGASRVKWTSVDGRKYSYFAGDGTKTSDCTCGQTEPSSCENGAECNCDAGGKRNDFGLLTKKNKLPIMNMTSSGYLGNSEMFLTVGPLECQEIFPNCADMKVFDKFKFVSENKMENGDYLMDPDGPEGVEPFVVTCTGSKTTLPGDQDPDEPTEGDPDNGVEKCYDFNYKSPNGKPVSPEQVQALVDSSRFCTQSLKQECLNAPLSEHTTFYTCDGVEQTGWAGSRGEDTCACGLTGTCEGGPDAKCNCDLENGEMLSDTGNIVDKERLAVCRVCVSLDSTSSLTSDPKVRRVRPTVSDLVCDVKPVGRGTSCQNWRDQGIVRSGSMMMNVANVDPFPTYCVLNVYPPTGWTEIYPKEPEIPVPPGGVDVTIEYFVFEMEFIVTLIKQSGYCTQELWLECQDSSFSLTGQNGWYSRDNERQAFWAGNEDGTTGCAGGDCQCNLGGVRVDGGLIVDQKLLPIMRVVLGPASGNRKLKVGPVKCFDLYKDCEDIRKNRAKTNPLGNHTYAIDPDQAGGVAPFAVVCDFKTHRNMGITVVPVITSDDRTVRGFYPPSVLEVSVQYDSVDYNQIHELTEISGYCHQGLEYICYNSPLTHNKTNPSLGYYKNYGGQRSPSFGVAGDSSVEGCACTLLNTCPEGHSCHCDVDGQTTIDYANEIDRSALPVTWMEFGGQYREDAWAVYSISDVRCGPKPFDLPKDCQEAFERGLRSGEHLILPSPEVEPYLVYCDMSILDKGGVTIIGHDREIRTTVTYNGTVDIKYINVDFPGLKALTEISNYCFQGFKYECRNTKLLSRQGYFYWHGGMTEVQSFIGTGRWYDQECNCGRDGYCGGSENKTTLAALLRPCNCDAADDEDRADAGIFNSTNRLPIMDFTFESTGIPESAGAVTVGKLYCSKQDFDIDECELGFHDCHIHAKCINTYGSYECQCKEGWKGLGRDDVWANGRNCYDDEECVMNYCPWSATCTNLPGSFECVCKEGFTQVGKRRCRDNDECAAGTHNCHENARCINIDGSFECRCNRNYRGDGITCEPLALCACFGDPHCLTSDGHLIDYQGECQYVMSRDKCDDLSSTPTYEVLTTFKSRGGASRADVSWVKEVTFKIYNYTIELMQNSEFRVNGYTQVYFREERVSILRFGRYVEVHTDIGVELSWDGDEVIELYTPGQYGGTTCGLCGNYNGDPEDDTVVGPQCPDSAGEITDSFSLFGDSWVVPAYVEKFPECFANCSGPEEPGLCKDRELAIAELTCNAVYSMSGSFRACLVQMDSNDLKNLKRSCVYDVCADGEEDLCEAAAFLFRLCRKQYGVILTQFRSEDFCEVKCGDNMVYDICGYANQKNCYDVVTKEPAKVYSGECVEGCFCKEGYVLDGDVCVLPEDCGCFYEGKYYKVGDEVVNGACDEKVICLKNGSMDTEDLECHKDAKCELRDGFHGCHCPEDYYGDGVKSCTPDPCTEDPCLENEVCVQNTSIPVGYVCECVMGFIGDCGNCTEIDECKTATYECTGNSKCVNTIGSYKCECRDGYFEFDGRCTDIDECEMAKLTDTPICGNNSRCSNRIGNYECPCCSGYKKDKNGECVETSAAIPESEEGPRCCICNIAICDRPGKVCGEDGIEYNSIRDMIISNCEKGLPVRKHVEVDYYGRCKGSCSKVKCPMYQYCVMKNGIPTCECDECTEEESKSEPVCTTHLDIYPDMCTFKKIQCMFDAEVTLLDSVLPCEGKGKGEPVGPWSEWSECSVTCGKGVSTKTREQYIPLTPKQTEKYPLSVETDCYGPPCPDGPCDVPQPCDNTAAMCIVNEDGEKECECPTCENQFDPVCAFVVGTYKGVSEGSYKSACHVQKLACERNLPDYEVMHKGPCGVEPLNCTRVPYSDYVTDDNDNSFVSDNKVNLFDCEGGCGRSKEYCCQKSDSEVMTVTLKNGNDTKQKTVQVIKACECEELITVPAQ